MMRIGVVAASFLAALMPFGNFAWADCSLVPSGSRPNGAIIKNTDLGVLQYCDGTVWRLLSLSGDTSCFETWTPRESNQAWDDIASSSDGANLAAVVNGGQIYTSTDGGASWTPRATSRNWYAIASSADGNKLAAGVDGGQIYTSTDSGINWTARDSNRAWVGIASSADGTNLAAVVYGGQIYTSTDSGANWTPRDSSRNWYAIASSADGTKLAAVVDGGQIFTSTDSGANWTARDSNRTWREITSSSDGTILAATVNGGKIHTSADSGVTWTARDSNAAWSGITISSDGARLAATVSGGAVYVSNDGGINWTPRASNRTWEEITSSADGTKLFAIVNGGQIYASQCTGDGGGGAEPACADDDTATCTLDATRDSGDPEFIAANIADGVNILGVTGTAPAGCTAPSLCPNVGNTCDDGNAGNNPDPKFAGFMIYGTSCKPLYVSSADQSSSSKWRSTGSANDIATDSLTDGQVNDGQIADTATWPAFKLCKDLTNGGFTDWYLPARDEMNLLYLNRAAIGNITVDRYWTSSEYDNSNGWYYKIDDGNPENDEAKTIGYYVRCVRRD